MVNKIFTNLFVFVFIKLIITKIIRIKVLELYTCMKVYFIKDYFVL